MTQLDTTSREFWEAAYIHSTEALFITDADGTFSHWSKSFGHMVGPVAAQGTSLFQAFHPDDRESLAATWARLSETTDSLELRGRVRVAEDIYAPFSWVLRRAPHGGAVFGSLHKASDGIHRATSELRKGGSADMLRVLSDNLPVIVWAIEQDGVLTYHGGKGAESLGLRWGQLVGMNIFDVFSGSPKDTAEVRQALQGESIHSSTQAAITNGGFWENWMVPIKDSLGNVESVVGLSLDISEQQKAEEELRTRLLQIQRQQEVIGKLSTPIIQVWDGVLALPMIGVVDSVRTSDVMQKLLDEIVRTGAHYAILDLTGVEMVDTQVADHMIKLVNAIRLLGAGGIICGIRPSVAQIIVELGLDLTSVVTRANLRAGLMFCIGQMRRLNEKPGPPVAG